MAHSKGKATLVNCFTESLLAEPHGLRQLQGSRSDANNSARCGICIAGCL
jgi:hypothetical protein